MNSTPAPDGAWQSRFISASDGLRLHGRIYGPRFSDIAPLVCLPGLTRNSADFHSLALSLTRDATRRVIALDYRGRGESGYDADWRRYDPLVEAEDALAFLTAIGVDEATFLGTSRGGLVLFVLAAMRPTLIRAAILNDIGPVIDAQGLIRIRSQVGKLPAPRNYDEAADVLRSMMGAHFTNQPQEEWLDQARATWREAEGGLTPRYDRALMNGLALLDLEKPLPNLWPHFMALRHVPLLAIRGANSDLFTAGTLAEMAARHPDCETLTVPDQGHAPLLTDAPTQAAIEAFLTRVDARLNRAA
ncbi:alpha/beta hydrolase [Terrarubrum flagellatum]|uniref:alpha/beta fold hydrolase n=1 Tax=Terrirubrum flagellatum TaxID=2895980 RepID=UPI0031455DE3